MSTDITIQPTGNFAVQNPTKITPLYLITLERGKKEVSFIATKLELNSFYLKVVGFYSNEETKDIVSGYQQLLTKTNKELYMELVVPYNRVLEIRNLIYKQK